MAIRCDTSSWLAGAILVGDTGFGVLGSGIATAGEDGAGYAYNDLSLPADAAKEICGRITSWPSAGTLTAYEDTSFSFTGAADGTYTFDYTLYVDGVAVGTATVALVVGNGNVLQIPAAALTITGHAPTILASNAHTIDIPVAALTLAAHAPTVVVTGVLDLIRKILGNRQELDAAAGKFRLYDDDSVTVLYEVGAWADAAGTIPYSGGTLARIDRLA